MDSSSQSERIIRLAQQVLSIEAQAVADLASRIDHNFVNAVRMVLSCPGRTIVTGIGKTGHIARKLAATLSSTGTPAYFVHAAEAAHGDLGMITRNDVLIAISNSGEGEELLRIVPIIKRWGGKLISMTGNPTSSLAVESDIHLNASVAQEACPHNLAPTASTTAALALGDALAVALLDARGFGPEDFARSHPGGSLGRKLLTHVADVMRPCASVPTASETTPLPEAVLAISRGGLGLVVILDSNNKVSGVFTDGDLRRAFEQHVDLVKARLGELMTRNPHTLRPEQLAVDAVEMMERLKINALVVTDDHGNLHGALNMHDLFNAKVI